MVVEGRAPEHPLARTMISHIPKGALVHVAAHTSMQPGQETSLDSTWASQRSHTSDKIRSTPPLPIHSSSIFASMPPSSHANPMNFLKDNNREHEQRLVPNWLLMDKSDSTMPRTLPVPSAWRDNPPPTPREGGHKTPVHLSNKLPLPSPSPLPPYLSPSSRHHPRAPSLPSPYPGSLHSEPSLNPSQTKFHPHSSYLPYQHERPHHPDEYYRRPDPIYTRPDPSLPSFNPSYPPRTFFDPVRQDSRPSLARRDPYYTHEYDRLYSEPPFPTHSLFHDPYHRPATRPDSYPSSRDSLPPHLRPYDPRVPTQLLRSDFARSDMEAHRSSSDTHRTLTSDKEFHRIERVKSDPDLVEHSKRTEYIGSHRSELHHHSDYRRQDVIPLRHSLSPSSPPRSPPSSASSLDPPSPYKRKFDTFARQEPALAFTNSNTSSFTFPPKPHSSRRPEPRSPSRSSSRSPPSHDSSTSATPTTPTTSSTSPHRSPSSHPTGPPSPIFTMENFGIQSDGSRLVYPHPKNPVKFEFKDFKENEYNLHNLQNSSGASLLSLKQQKRHKRIINRALAQGHARARVEKGEDEEQTEVSDVNEVEPKRRRRVPAQHAGEKPALTDEIELKQEREDQLEQQRPTKRKPKAQTPIETPLHTKAARREKSMEGRAKNIEEERVDIVQDESTKPINSTLQNSADALFEQYRSYQELQQNMVPKRSSSRLRTKSQLGRSSTGSYYCICKRPETDSMVQCDSCDKWYHFECVNLTEEMAQDLMQYFCTECRGRGSLVRKARIEDLISESDQPTRATSPPDSPSSSTSSTTCSDSLSPFSPTESTEDPEADDVLWDTAEEGGRVQLGEGVVSLSSLAKQPWMDGWVTARSLAVRYLQEAKNMGYEITETRRLPKQGTVRMPGKGKRAWRQAEVLLAIQFLKSADLVETSTKKGTLVREPSKTMDDLIHRAQTVVMSNRGNIGKVKVVEFARQRNQQPAVDKERGKERGREQGREKGKGKERERGSKVE